MLSLIFSILLSTPAQASVYPEYEHLTDYEQQEIVRPRLVDGEYESDRLAYRLPLQWMLPWLANEKVFQYGAGSLGPTRFLSQGRLKLNSQLSDRLKFLFAYVEQGDVVQNQKAILFEFSYQFFDFLSVALYGEPSTLKREDDIGLASVFHLGPQQRLRLFYTWVDFSHNKRNENSDQYAKTPASYGAVWRKLNEQTQEFWEIFLRRDQETRRVFEAPARVYSYSLWEGGLKARHRLTDNGLQHLQWQVQAMQKYEGDTLNTDSGVERWDFTSYETWLQHELSSEWVDLYGIAYVYKDWQSSQGEVTHSDLLPHLWSPIYLDREGSVTHALHAGYEFTWHRGYGPEALRSTLDKNNNLEHRLNLRYRASYGLWKHFVMLLTFDLDRFGTGDTWEGGSIRFTSDF